MTEKLITVVDDEEDIVKLVGHHLKREGIPGQGVPQREGLSFLCEFRRPGSGGPRHYASGYRRPRDLQDSQKQGEHRVGADNNADGQGVRGGRRGGA